jgi:hypothetical protein
MTRSQLLRFSNNLNPDILTDRILINKKGYYVYFNEPNKKKRTIKIHHHTCGNCCFGSGKLPKGESGRNGVWIGPSNSVNNLVKLIKVLLNESPKICSCVDLNS